MQPATTPSNRPVSDTEPCSGVRKPSSREIIRKIVDALNDIAGVETVFKNGAVHPGGPHYRLAGMSGPISIGEDECRALGALIDAFNPTNAFIIGNAFGLSGVFVAAMMQARRGQRTVTLDNQSEGEGQRIARIAEQLRERLGCDILINWKGSSPVDIPAAAENKLYDFIFIDGLHRHPQVTRDFFGILPIATPNAIVCWHDYWMTGIPKSVEEAQRAGFQCIKVNTSCEMVFGSRDEGVFNTICSLFENTEAPKRRLRPGAFLKLCCALTSAAVRKRIAAKPR